MLTLIVPAAVPAQQIDDFPAKGCERSRRGAVYVRPASTMKVTEEEWQHITRTRKALARALIVVRKDAPSLSQRLAAKAKPTTDPYADD